MLKVFWKWIMDIDNRDKYFRVYGMYGVFMGWVKK
jgi:hypothetical protein